LGVTLRGGETEAPPAPEAAMSSSRRAALLAAVAVSAGCDHSWDLDVTVAVPAATQAAVGTYPRQLMLRYGPPGDPAGPVHRLAVLCAAGADPSTARAHYHGLGPRCSAVYEVEAWLAPANDPALSSLPCGPYDVEEDLPPDAGPWTTPQAGEPYAARLAFDGGCKTSDAVSLTLAAP
jgi:hypothetical protein